MEREQKFSLVTCLFTYMPNETVLLNCRYKLDEEEKSSSETQVTSHSHYKTQESLRKDVPDKSLTNVHELNCQEGLQKDLHEVSSANGQAQIIQENLLKDVPKMVFRHHRPQFKPENFDNKV